jgi:uncharacterized RDD family membrane protein YckC
MNAPVKGVPKAAPLMRRYGALLIDYLLILGYGAVLFMLSTIFPVVSRLFASDAMTSHLSGFLLFTFPVLLYFVLWESSSHRGTLGKRKFGIQVVDPSGERIGKSRALLRSMAKFLPWELAHFGIWRLHFPGDVSEAAVMFLLTIQEGTNHEQGGSHGTETIEGLRA